MRRTKPNQYTKISFYEHLRSNDQKTALFRRGPKMAAVVSEFSSSNIYFSINFFLVSNEVEIEQSPYSSGVTAMLEDGTF